VTNGQAGATVHPTAKLRSCPSLTECAGNRFQDEFQGPTSRSFTVPSDEVQHEAPETEAPEREAPEHEAPENEPHDG
jgi:hypothetical protein